MSSTRSIRLRGVRQNNLKNFDLDLPLRRLTVVTGLSGSGKSSLAFDTLFAEGQRRYIETFSPYARQFFDRMDKPQVDRIEGIPPAIAIEQRNSVRTTRSTVGTMTELCDYMKLLWPHLAQLHCRQCGQSVRREPPQWIWETFQAAGGGSAGGIEVLITFNLPLSDKISLKESLELVARQGYQRLLSPAGDELVRLEEAAGHPALASTRGPVVLLTIVQDRLLLAPARRARFVEACEQAYHFGKGKLAVWPILPGPAAGSGGRIRLDAARARHFSQGFHCATCDLDYREPTPALFSFNHPVGACPACKGFGRVISIDYDLAIPDWSRTLAEGCVRPWQTGHGLESHQDMMKFCRAKKIPTDVPFAKLPEKIRNWVIQGDADYGVDAEHQWPRRWYGVKGYFRWLESKSYKMHVRVLLSRYRAYTTCADCRGQRFQPESLLFRVPLPAGLTARIAGTAAAGRGVLPGGEAAPARAGGGISLADFYGMPVEGALGLLEELGQQANPSNRRNDPLTLALGEVRSRLQYLAEVGLGYLTLDRPMRTLSGGETERVNLTTCLGTRLCNTLFVLDEPSVGLHPRDTARLIRILHALRDAGNTVVVVEHEGSVMRAADWIVDLGPGRGEQGGRLVFTGPFPRLLAHPDSLTGKYLSGRMEIAVPARRPVALVEGAGRRGGHEGEGEPEPGQARGPSRAGGMWIQEAVASYGENAETPASLWVRHAARHNLRDLTVGIPLRRFVCLTGVSGSGKTTLMREILLPVLARHLGGRAAGKGKEKGKEREQDGAPDRDKDRGQEEEEGSKDRAGSGPQGPEVEGWESLRQVVLVDQSPLSKTPRSNPVVYVGAFDDIRELFAQTATAKQRGLGSSAFSFNSGVGQCERCRGAGFEKIEMQFLSDIFIRCPECQGRRYRAHILEVKLDRAGLDLCESGSTAESGLEIEVGNGSVAGSSARKAEAPLASSRAWSVAEFLEATVDDAVSFLGEIEALAPARRAMERLQLLQEVGLGYLRLGQPLNTLSGGESQRLKLVSHLADAGLGTVRIPPGGSLAETEVAPVAGRRRGPGRAAAEPEFTPTIFLFDEPTTGLHFEDVRVLLGAFQRLVDAGHSLIVIEHNLDVIKCADWVIELGPEAGEGGGEVVVAGTPEEVAACAGSHTGEFLKGVLPKARKTQTRPESPKAAKGKKGRS